MMTTPTRQPPPTMEDSTRQSSSQYEEEISALMQGGFKSTSSANAFEFDLQQRRKQSGNHLLPDTADSYRQLLALYAEQEQQVMHTLQANKKLVQNNTQLQGELEKCQTQQIELLQSTIADSAKAQEITEAKEKQFEQMKRDLECKVKEIEDLNDEMAALTADHDCIRKRLSDADDMVAKLQEDNKCTHDLVIEQARKIQEDGKDILDLQVQCKQLKEDVEHWRGQSGVDEHAMESLEVKVNMQRQLIEDKTNHLNTLVKRLQARDMNLIQFIERANEVDRMKAAIEERDRKFVSRERTLENLRQENGKLKDENLNLLDEKRKLNTMLAEINAHIDDGSKVQMPWLLAQLRDTYSLKEEVSRLNEIIQGSGYTVRAAEAEKDFNQRSQELKDEKEALRSIITTLRGQVAKIDDFGSERYVYSSAYLLGKLEECAEPHQALAVLSVASDADDMTLNINLHECDDQSLMDQEESGLIDSFLKGIYGPEGLICTTAADESPFHDEDFDARDDIDANIKDDASDADSVDTDRVDGNEQGIDEATPAKKTDFHLDLVESTLNRNDGNKDTEPLLDNWRDWLPSPPTSPSLTQSAE